MSVITEMTARHRTEERIEAARKAWHDEKIDATEYARLVA